MLVGQDAGPYLAAMAAAGSADMLTEQVWDTRPPTGQALLHRGRGHPLGDAADLVTRPAGAIGLDHPGRQPLDRQVVVAQRYQV